MSSELPADEILNREFLVARAKVLEIAATFDRIDRAEGSVENDPRMASLQKAIQLLMEQGAKDRAEQVQMIFSKNYEEDWKKGLGVE